MEMSSVNAFPKPAGLLVFVSRGHCWAAGGGTGGGRSFSSWFSHAYALTSLGSCRVCGSFQQHPVANNKQRLPTAASPSTPLFGWLQSGVLLAKHLPGGGFSGHSAVNSAEGTSLWMDSFSKNSRERVSNKSHWGHSSEPVMPSPTRRWGDVFLGHSISVLGVVAAPCIYCSYMVGVLFAFY